MFRCYRQSLRTKSYWYQLPPRAAALRGPAAQSPLICLVSSYFVCCTVPFEIIMKTHTTLIRNLEANVMKAISTHRQRGQ
jgi:hypothetical protein